MAAADRGIADTVSYGRKCFRLRGQFSQARSSGILFGLPLLLEHFRLLCGVVEYAIWIARTGVFFHRSGSFEHFNGVAGSLPLSESRARCLANANVDRRCNLDDLACHN